VSRRPGQDRAAITLAGLHPDGVYWFENRPPGGFTTSRYYRDALPDWAERWHGIDPPGDAFLSRVPERWEHATGAPPNAARMDDTPWEVARFQRVSGHPLRSEERKKFLDQLYFSPWLDTLTLEFGGARGAGEARPARRRIARRRSLRHRYRGTSLWSGKPEARDALRRLDADLGVSRRAGEGPGRGACSSSRRTTASSSCRSTRLGGRQRARARGASTEGAGEGAEAASKRRSSLRAAHRTERRGRPASLTTLNRGSRAHEGAEGPRGRALVDDGCGGGGGIAKERSCLVGLTTPDPERSGDLTLQTEPGCVLAPYPSGTSHGTPHLYDRAVPLVFLGPGIAPGVVRGRAAPVDVAPSLARQLGVPVPAGLDGQALPLSDE
jgi:hypothetical protein